MERRGWEQLVGSEDSLDQYGHLLAGAPTTKLVELHQVDDLNKDLIGKVVNNTRMNPIRVRNE